MQIHEITQRRVNEGYLSDFGRGLGDVAKGVGQNIFTAAGGGDFGPGNAAKSAARSAAGLTAQGYGTNYQKPSEKWQDKYKQISTDPTIKQYAAGIAQGWIKNSGKLVQDFVPPIPAATTTPTAKKPARGAKWGSFKPGQMSSGLAGSKTGQTMQKMFGAPKGGIQDMQSDLTEADTADIEKYKQAFVKFTDEQFATKVSNTGETITMDMVRAHQQGLAAELTKALDRIVQTQGTAAQTAAIEEYAKLAVAGVQAEAQRSKNQYGTQQTSLGIGSRDLANLKALASTPAGKEMLIKQLGL